MIYQLYKQSRSSTHDNYAFRGDSDPEETTISEDDTSEEMYEKITPHARFTDNPANRGFGSVNNQ